MGQKRFDIRGSVAEAVDIACCGGLLDPAIQFVSQGRPRANPGSSDQHDRDGQSRCLQLRQVIWPGVGRLVSPRPSCPPTETKRLLAGLRNRSRSSMVVPRWLSTRRGRPSRRGPADWRRRGDNLLAEAIADSPYSSCSLATGAGGSGCPGAVIVAVRHSLAVPAVAGRERAVQPGSATSRPDRPASTIRAASTSSRRDSTTAVAMRLSGSLTNNSPMRVCNSSGPSGINSDHQAGGGQSRSSTSGASRSRSDALKGGRPAKKRVHDAAEAVQSRNAE